MKTFLLLAASSILVFSLSASADPQLNNVLVVKGGPLPSAGGPHGIQNQDVDLGPLNSNSVVNRVDVLPNIGTVNHVIVVKGGPLPSAGGPHGPVEESGMDHVLVKKDGAYSVDLKSKFLVKSELIKPNNFRIWYRTPHSDKILFANLVLSDSGRIEKLTVLSQDVGGFLVNYRAEHVKEVTAPNAVSDSATIETPKANEAR